MYNEHCWKFYKEIDIVLRSSSDVQAGNSTSRWIRYL